MTSALRYARLLGSLGRYTLAREMAFRGNFLVKVIVEVIWLGILLAFYRTVFAKTSVIASWTEPEYLFFVGCFFALNGLIETLFLENCNEFAQLVRSGDLDFLLLKPIDEQFLITLRRIDWGCAPNVIMGAAVMGIALVQMHWAFDLGLLVCFLALFVCGTLIAYSFMLVLTSFSVWLVRNQSLMEMWWLFSSLARYPKEIFLRHLGRADREVLHVCAADLACVERAGAYDGQGDRAGAGGVHVCGHGGECVGQSVVFPQGSAVLPKRQ